MPARYQTKRRIEFVDTDMAGIVHFSNFFRFMECAEQEFLQGRGLSVSMDWQGQQLGFPRVAASCDYLRPIRFQDEVDIEVEVVKVGRKSVTYRFGFSLQGVKVAEGQMSSVCCRVDRARHEIESIEIPPDIRARLEA